MMQFIKNENTTLEKEKNNLRSLELLIEEDRTKKDYKSLEYHTIAYECTLKRIKELETKV